MADEEEFVSADYVAARVDSFTSLLAHAETIKDRKLRDEAVLMLRAVRMSFKTEPQGQLVAIKSQLGRPA
jgi:hypothetical protein